MKVLIITPRYPPTFHGGGEISLKLLAENLKKNNIEVTVLSFDGNKEDTINDVKIIRKYLSVKSSFFKKLKMMLHIKKISKEYNLIHAYNIFFYEYLGLLSIFFTINIVGTLNNLPEISLGETKNPFKRLKRKFFNNIRLGLIRNLHCLICLSETLKQEYLKKGFNDEKLIVIPNMIDTSFSILNSNASIFLLSSNII